MNWVVVLIILVVIAAISGPIMLLQPSSRQRAQAALREKAATLGLRVRMVPQLKSDASSLIIYERPWLREELKRVGKSWGISKQKYAHGLHFHELWDWDTPAPESVSGNLKALLDELPDSAVTLGQTEGGVHIIWGESGGEDAISAVASVLDKTAKLALA